MTLKEGNEVEVFGNSVRVHNLDSAVWFYFSERTTMVKLFPYFI